MAIYEYACDDCMITFTVRKPMAECSTPEDCPKCEAGEHTRKLISAVGFVLKGDDWASKNNRIAGQMREKNVRLKAKEEEQKRAGLVPTLVPNVEGERTETWEDARKLAASKGKSTAGYEPYVRKEKSST